MKFKAKRQLNEALSPTVPDWLKPSLFNLFSRWPYYTYGLGNYSRDTFTKYISGHHEHPGYTLADLVKKKNSYAKHGYDTQSNLATGYYKKGRGGDKFGDFVNSLSKSIINFAGAEFIHVDPPPKKGTDPLLISPNYQVFMLLEGDEGQQIYAPGLNDKEPCRISYGDLWNKTFKYISYHQLRPFIKDFCYVDLTKPESTMSRVRDAKYRPSQEYKRVTQAYSNNYDYDKSGYPRNPNKYNDALKRIKAEKQYKQLDDTYQRLLKCRELMSDTVPYVADIDFDAKEIARGIDQLQEATNSYNTVLRNIDMLKNQYTDDELYKQIIDYFNNGYDVRHMSDGLNEAEEIAKKYAYVQLDW